VTVDDADLPRREHVGRRDHVLDHRPACKDVQDLGQLRIHALALSRGKDDDVHGHLEIISYGLSRPAQQSALMPASKCKKAAVRPPFATRFVSNLTNRVISSRDQ
jgi:hypothetical protein